MNVHVAKCQICPNRLRRHVARSESGDGLRSTIRQEEPGDGDSDDGRGSGEYFSGEDFHEDDVMLTHERYCEN